MLSCYLQFKFCSKFGQIKQISASYHKQSLPNLLHLECFQPAFKYFSQHKDLELAYVIFARQKIKKNCIPVQYYCNSQYLQSQLNKQIAITNLINKHASSSFHNNNFCLDLQLIFQWRTTIIRFSSCNLTLNLLKILNHNIILKVGHTTTLIMSARFSINKPKTYQHKEI